MDPNTTSLSLLFPYEVLQYAFKAPCFPQFRQRTPHEDVRDYLSPYPLAQQPDAAGSRSRSLQVVCDGASPECAPASEAVDVHERTYLKA